MYISGVQYESIVDGEGLRLTLFCSGCYWNCAGCQNPATHSFTYGKTFDEDLQEDIINYIHNSPIIKGITLSGGDPMFNAQELIKFIIKAKNKVKNINIWCYTGFTFENILSYKDEKTELLKLCDILVDGKFEMDKKDVTLAFRGSSNQRIIDIKESLKQNKVVLYLE